jgi:hypothetical protein
MGKHSMIERLARLPAVAAPEGNCINVTRAQVCDALLMAGEMHPDLARTLRIAYGLLIRLDAIRGEARIKVMGAQVALAGRDSTAAAAFLDGASGLLADWNAAYRLPRP